MLEKTATSGGLQAFDFQADLAKQASEIYEQDEPLSETEKAKRPPKSVLHGILRDSVPSDRSPHRLHQEATTLVGAGSETTGNALEVMTYHIVRSPSILSKLKSELASQSRPISSLSSEDLKKLPYLSSCITEGLRLSCGVTGRLPRVNPTSPTTYKDYNFPAGTVISMNISDIHFDPVLYPEPYAFVPERWLVDPEARRVMEQYFVPFNRGPRSCVGRDLAQVELYLVLANVIDRFEMQLFETTEYDISMKHDFFSPFGPIESEGLRVTLRDLKV